MLPHPIKITDEPGPYLRLFLQKREYTKVVVLTDDNTVKHCYPLLKEFIPDHALITVASGEEHKTLQTCETIWTVMTDQLLDRHSALLIVGGGVLGDMGGFCAVTFKRGIDFILLPTTLLAMADASIGGKLGVDFRGFKNHIGTFQEPALNLLFRGFLETLPKSELRSGFAEVIKHTLISDRTLWNEVRSNPLENQPWDIFVRHSAEFKSAVVREDPKEKGRRKILNAGHTIGHALESHFLLTGRKILHGEAIAAGLICEAYLSHQKDMLETGDFDEISKYLLQVYGKLPVEQAETRSIAELCIQDKKNKGNKVLAALLDGIGKARWDCEISMDQIVQSLAYYQSLQM